jgi:CheY-like chemotaxis protein
VLINFLSNAVKYNKVGGSVIVDYVTVTPGCIRIRVLDTGEGLPAEMLAQLFQPFNRLGKEAGIEEGTGIGLMVSKQLVELMNGRIGAESTVGVGSVFLVRAEPRDGAAAGRDRGEDDRPRTGARRLAGAHPPLCRGQSRQPDAGRGPGRAPARHPLAQRDRRQSRHRDRARVLPDVVLMDINLPGISGVQALKLLRAGSRDGAHPRWSH